MAANELIGLILVGVGLSEPLVGFLVASRMANPASGGIVKLASISSGLLLVALGVALYSGALALE